MQISGTMTSDGTTTTPIALPYEQPDAAPAGVESDADLFTFASPPVRPQIALLTVAILACALAALVAAGFALDLLDENDPVDLPLAFCMVVVVTAAAAIPLMVSELGRLRRYAHVDLRLRGIVRRHVQLAVRGRQLLAWAPQQWGGAPRAVDVTEVAEIRATRAWGLNLAVPVYRICIAHARPCSTRWVISVAVADRGLVDRAIVDLKNAVERAASAVVAPELSAHGSGT